MLKGTPGTPATPTVKSATLDCVTLKWQSVDTGGEAFVIEKYIVIYSMEGSIATKEDVKNVSQEERRLPDVMMTIRGLAPETKYTFQVAAENGERRGKLSESVTQITAAAEGWSFHVFR